MIRVKWYVGRRGLWSDYANEEEMRQRVNQLRTVGFHTKSKAGVVTYYPTHRIRKITCRVLPAKG